MQTFLEIPVGHQKLAACLHRPGSDRAPGPPVSVVICCHGLTGSRNGTGYRMVGLGRRLVAENMACLRFDFRGCGESDGRFEDLSAATLLEDLHAVVAALDRLPGCDSASIGLLGSSFGAFTAAGAAGQIGGGLRCLAFWAPVADVGWLIDSTMTEASWAFLREHQWVEHNGLRLGAAFFNDIQHSAAPELLAEARRPVLIYHATGDQQVPIAHGRAYETALGKAGVEVRLEPIDAEDHAMRSVATSDRILEGTVAWFRRFLQPEPSSRSTS